MSNIADTLDIRVEYYTGLEEDDDVGHPYYVASCSRIGLVTDGETFEELLKNVYEVLALILEDVDTVAEYQLAPDAKVVLHMELPSQHAKAA